MPEQLDVPPAGPGDQLAERLRTAVLNLDLLPGEKLTERGLEGLLGVSRTPARAALMRLENEGLVRRDGRGWEVTPIDLEEIGALAELREAVEVAAVRYAVTRATDDDLAAIAGLLDQARHADGEDAGMRAGSDFHTHLARLSGNPLLVDAVSNAMLRLQRTRWLDIRSPATRARAWQEHRQILDAVAARDAEEAARALGAHIRTTNQRLLDNLTAQQRPLRGRGITVIGASPRH